MSVIRCTSRLLAGIDDPSMDDVAPSAVGDWYGNIFTVKRRKCILFINERTLFVCLGIAVKKADYAVMSPFSSTCSDERYVRKDSASMKPLGFSASTKL